MFICDLVCWILEVYYVIPFLLFLFPHLAIIFVYNNWFTREKSSKFEDFESFGINPKGARNFYLNSRHDGIRLGIWQMLPYQESVTTKLGHREFELALADETPIFMLYHGDGHHRGVKMHVGRQKLLSKLGYHVFTMDYRGFGDSEGVPTSDMSLTDDAITLYAYVRQFAPSKEIFLFASSLGCGISATLIKVLSTHPICKPPAGILLDSCFDSFIEVMRRSRFAYCFMGLIGFEPCFRYNMDLIGVHMNIVKNLKNCKCPITMVHSEDDHVVEFTVGKNVYLELNEIGLDIQFYNFGRSGFRHNRNYMAPEMPQILHDLIKRARA